MQEELGSILLWLSSFFESSGLWTWSCDCPSQLMEQAGMQEELGSILLWLSSFFESSGLWMWSCDCPSQLMAH